MRLPRLAARSVALVAVGAVVLAHVRLIYPANGNALFWDDEDDIEVTINSAGSDDISDDSHFTAIRNAIAAWNDVTGTKAKLKEVKKASAQASQNWQSFGKHLILFDENNSSAFFPSGSGIVAVTPIVYSIPDGEIVDADILFNGMDFLFTTSGQAGRYDVQDVATHELGHLLGLDHSGCAGATMYPYVDSTVILHRSLSADDVQGLRHMYPTGTTAKIVGTVKRSSNQSLVLGAWVAARDANGRLAAAALTNSNGRFALRRLAAGTYTVYAMPLDGPVGAGNLSSGHTVQTNFEATVLGVASPGGSGTVEMGDCLVGDDVSVVLGSVSDDYPLRAVAGQGNALTVRGSGLVGGSTLAASDPTVVLSSIHWNGNSVSFTATPPAGAGPGHVDLTATTPSGTAILCAGLEITPPDPTITDVSPASGDALGGYDVTLTGTGFRPGLRVVIGDRIYAEGSDATLVDPTTVVVDLEETVLGTHDVVVIDETGVEGRDDDAFEAWAVPIVDSVFPVAGSDAGGTTVTIRGDKFVAGTTVEIDGIAQSNVTVEDLDEIRVVTDPGAAGGPYVLRVVAPPGAEAQAAFTYSPKPDPLVLTVDPSQGPAEGGKTVTITGTGFTAESEVFFGVGAAGNGGKKARNVTFVDANTLQAKTPTLETSKTAMMVRESDTLQASLLPGAYAFQGSLDSGGGGGGCGSIAPQRPPTWRDVVSGAGWIAVLAFLLAARALRRPALGA